MAGKNRKRSVLFTWVILLIGIVLIAVSGINIYKILTEYQVGEEEYEELNQLVQSYLEEKEPFAPAHPQDGKESGEGQETGEMEPEGTWAPQLGICEAVAKLKEGNEDVIGWLLFDNMDISYPIMQGRTNDDYIHTTYQGVTNTAGSIFMESLNHADFQDSHTIIYGHNMKNGSMFGKLKQYKNDGHYEENRYFTIYTADKAYRYEIFAYYDIAADGPIYNIHFETTDEFQELLDYMYKKSYWDTGVTAGVYDKVVTLSTCSANDKRFVVNAVRVEEYSRE